LIHAACSPAKANSEPAAQEALQNFPSATFPALARHLRERAGLFFPAVLAAVIGAIHAPKKSKAELQFEFWAQPERGSETVSSREPAENPSDDRKCTWRSLVNRCQLKFRSARGNR
jgi:hypothetical protein